MDVKYLKVKYKFLMWCGEDYSSLFSLFSFVKEFYGFKDIKPLKEMTLKILKELLETELIKIGFITDENKFNVWKEDLNNIMNKIKFQWDNLNRDLYPHEIAWFDITVKGVIEFEHLINIPEVIEVDDFYKK
ncbi:MAG: hypothetical protein HZB76_03920 [Chlamydiae bacterium]|nr:hypothetical protein [Chlamydiota bacterium]